MRLYNCLILCQDKHWTWKQSENCQHFTPSLFRTKHLNLFKPLSVPILLKVIKWITFEAKEKSFVMVLHVRLLNSIFFHWLHFTIIQKISIFLAFRILQHWISSKIKSQLLYLLLYVISARLHLVTVEDTELSSQQGDG